jgi:hypothetical protein
MAAATAMTAVRSSFASATHLTHKERIDRALRGEDVDRPPFSFWHHYKRPTAQLEAQDHLEFHRRYDTDFVKVMNDFDYPRSTTGKWYELEPVKTPYPEQLHTLELVRDGLQGNAYFVDTLYGPYMTAMLLLAAEPEFAGKKNAEDRSERQHPQISEGEQCGVGTSDGSDHAIDHQPYSPVTGNWGFGNPCEYFQRDQ